MLTGARQPQITDGNIGKGFGRGMSDLLLGRWADKYTDISCSIYVQIMLQSLTTAKCFTFHFDTNFSVIWNVQGLNRMTKRTAYLEYIDSKHIDIAMIQESLPRSL